MIVMIVMISVVVAKATPVNVVKEKSGMDKLNQLRDSFDDVTYDQAECIFMINYHNYKLDHQIKDCIALETGVVECLKNIPNLKECFV
jgi:hypothetical protein